MKFNFKGVVVLAALTGILLLSSCNKNGVAPNAASTNTSNPQQSAKQSGDTSNPNKRGQQNRADLYGEIKSIKGNDITVALLQMPQGGQRQQGQSGQQGNQNNNNNTPNNGQGVNKGQSMQKNYTGETQTITISSDTAIASFERGNGNQGSANTQEKPQEKQLKLSDLKEGTIIQVWYKDANKKEIQNIRVMQLPN